MAGGGPLLKIFLGARLISLEMDGFVLSFGRLECLLLDKGVVTIKPSSSIDVVLLRSRLLVLDGPREGCISLEMDLVVVGKPFSLEGVNIVLILLLLD